MVIVCTSTYRYVWDYDGYDVKSIHFYNESGEVFCTDRGMLQPLHDKDMPTSYDDNDRFALRISGDFLQRRNKVNFAKKEHFYIRKKNNSGTIHAEIYLYVGEDSDIDLKIINTVKKKNSLCSSNNMIITYDIAELRSKYMILPVYLSKAIATKVTTTNIGKTIKEINETLKEHNECSIDSFYLEPMLKYFDVVPKSK